MVENEMRRAGIQIVCDFDPSDPDVVVDPNQISQVVINLLLNAKQAMDSGGDITLRTRNMGRMIQVQVMDTEKASPRESGTDLLIRFSRQVQPCGTGLAVVSRILEQHHARFSWKANLAKALCSPSFFKVSSSMKDKTDSEPKI